MNLSAPIFRFAPSPNGFLHLGHAFSALLNQRMAREHGGRFLLRVEDIDATRCRPEFETAIYHDLGWLGVRWESPVRRQSQHFADYARALGRLGDVTYPCFCSRSAIAAEVAVAARERGETRPWPRDPDGAPLYPGTCRDLPRATAARRAAQETFALRLDMTRAAARAGPGLSWRRLDAQLREDIVPIDAGRWGDVVLARKETPTSYHLSVVVDDALQGVSYVVRGRDLEAATDVHRVLQALLGLPPPRYHHHRLVTEDRGLKLAKSTGSTSLRDLRQAGVSAHEVRTALGFPDDSGPTTDDT